MMYGREVAGKLLVGVLPPLLLLLLLLLLSALLRRQPARRVAGKTPQLTERAGTQLCETRAINGRTDGQTYDEQLLAAVIERAIACRQLSAISREKRTAANNAVDADLLRATAPRDPWDASPPTLETVGPSIFGPLNFYK